MNSSPCRAAASHSARGSTVLYNVASSQVNRPCCHMPLSVSSRLPSRSRAIMNPPCSSSTQRGSQNGSVFSNNPSRYTAINFSRRTSFIRKNVLQFHALEGHVGTTTFVEDTNGFVVDHRQARVTGAAPFIEQ